MARKQTRKQQLKVEAGFAASRLDNASERYRKLQNDAIKAAESGPYEKRHDAVSLQWFMEHAAKDTELMTALWFGLGYLYEAKHGH